MTDPQQSDPIDQLFRKTFEDLPSAPAESGWDKPSERVWEKVQQQMPRKSPAPGSQSLAIAVLTVGALVALYLHFTQPTPPSTPPAESPAPEVAVPPAPRPSAEEAQTIDNQSVTTSPAKRLERAAQTVAEAPQAAAAREQRETPRVGGALPLPGTTDDARPNTTEERKAARARQLEQLWRTPLDPLPLARQKRAPH
jgi:hypothetical protein